MSLIQMLGHRTGRGGGPAGHRVPGLPLRALHVRTLRRPPLHRRTLLSLCGAGLLLPGRVVVRPLLVDLRPLQRTARPRRGTPPHRRARTSVAVVLLMMRDDRSNQNSDKTKTDQWDGWALWQETFSLI